MTAMQKSNMCKQGLISPEEEEDGFARSVERGKRVGSNNYYVWRLFLKIIFILKYIKIIYFYSLKLIFNTST